MSKCSLSASSSHQTLAPTVDLFKPMDQLSTRDDAAIAEELKSKVRSTYHAINTRNFDPRSPPWSFAAPSMTFSMDAVVCVEQGAEARNPKAHNTVTNTDLSTAMALQRQIAHQYPDYYIEVADMTATVDAKDGSGVADVVVNTLDHGIYPSIARAMVGVWCFEFLEGRWQCVAYHDMAGSGTGVDVR